MPDVREKRVELILQQLEELPTLPAVAMRVLQVTGNEQASAAEVVKLIESDQSLAARILQLLHRAGTGVSSDVTSLDRAVVLLGFEAVRSATLAISIYETFRGGPDKPNAHFLREEFWKHELATACCAELLAEASPDAKIDPGEAFLCGLLHDLGKVALDVALPKSFDRVVEATDLLRGNIADVERSVIGLDHMVVGKRLAEGWNLPATLRDCIWLHGQAPAALPATVKNPRLVNLITLADMLVREQHLGYSGNYSFTLSRNALAEAAGIKLAALETVGRELITHIEPRAKALGLGQASTTELYHQALRQANKELGRVSDQLISKNRRLAIRAQFFDALSNFQSELRPDSAPQSVLRAIGETAVSVLAVSSAGVFSLLPGQAFAEVMLFDNQGECFETTLIDCPKRPGPQTTGHGPVLTAGDELEWLLAAISPRLGEDHRFWIPLEADGHCIGGVVWGARGGEAQRLSGQVQELVALSVGWGLALRTSQIREESRALAEQLAEANRQLQTAQTEILRSKTLITVGEMAAGAAHEMNNPLAVISGRSQLLAAQLSDPKLKHAATLVYEQSHRLSEIITELMDFAKPNPATLREHDIAELVDRALHEAKSQTDPVDRTIEVTMGELPSVLVDGEQVRAAMVEVIGNALQATDERGGHIAIHAAFDPVSSMAVMTIADNGPGMEEQTLKRAFDPFFSSKPAGRRRGMGLAKALRWVEASGGSIRLESRPGKGTRSSILLPVSRTNQSADPAERKAL